MANTARTEKKVNAIVEEILDEDRDEDLGATRSGSCPENCDQSDDMPEDLPRRCRCGVEHSLRFSLRVMEAMRSLQRDAADEPATSTAEDIVEHIRANYRNDGDLYAQVRTALRQVCSRGFVIKLLDNEYHLIGPIVGCTNRSLDCEVRATNDTARGDLTNGVCRCRRSPRGNGRTREETPEEIFASDLSENLATNAILHSTERSLDADNADYRDGGLDRAELTFGCRDCEDIRHDPRQRRDVREIRETERRSSSIAGTSATSAVALSPISPGRRVRTQDRRMQVVDGNDREVVTKRDPDCACDADVVGEPARLRDRPRRGRPPVVTKKKRRRENTEEVAEEDTDDGAEDSAYRELRRRRPRRRSKARERELKRWIRRCRRECERRRPR